MEANVIMCRCGKCSKVYGIRVERTATGGAHGLSKSPKKALTARASTAM